MVANGLWPSEETMIPELLAAQPEARVVLDRYGLAGCGGVRGPSETLRFFARAHGVPVDRLLAELRDEADDRDAPPSPQPGASRLPIAGVTRGGEKGTGETKAAEILVPSVGDTIYRGFFKAGIAIVLTLGAVWGAYLLVRIALGGTFTAAGLHEVNAHGHAQIFGWVGLFVMGFAYQAFPRFKHTSLAHPHLALGTLWMMLVGIVVRSLCQPVATEGVVAWWATAWWAAVGASVLEVAAIVVFAALIIETWRRSGKRLAAYDYYILSALGWFVFQGVYESVYLTATLSAAGEGLVALVATWQGPLRDAQIHGFALLMILGVSQRIFHHFYALPEPNPRLAIGLLPVLNLAVVGEMLGLIMTRVAGHAWAALWYASVLALVVAVAVLVRSWRIYSPAEDGDRSLKFLRTAYVWLFVSLGMLVMLPVYQGAVLPWLAPESEAHRIGFSHAYYGATRHAITVGFISLMIVGVAAKVVPTLNGVNVRWLSSLWAPFVLINLGCTLRVVSQTLTDFGATAFAFAGVSGLLEVTGLALWGVHLWRIMSGHAHERSPRQPTESPSSPEEIQATSTVGDVLAAHPQLLRTFLDHGFTTLAQPAMRNTVARVVTIEQACRRTGTNLDTFLAALRQG